MGNRNPPDPKPALFGKLTPSRNGKLIRRGAVMLRKNDFFYTLGTCKDCEIRIRGFKSVGLYRMAMFDVTMFSPDPAEPFHCTLEYDSNIGFTSIKDRSVVNGTWVRAISLSSKPRCLTCHFDQVNGGRLSRSERTLLRNGDKITLGAPIMATSRGALFSVNFLMFEMSTITRRYPVFVFEVYEDPEPRLGMYYAVDWYKPIGVGSSAVVWKARKRLSFGPRAYRAVKALYCESDDVERQAHIANEIAICRKLAHPNICTFYDVVQDMQSNRACEFSSGLHVSPGVVTCPYNKLLSWN